MTIQAINALIARYAACLARGDAEGAAACVMTPTAVFYRDRVNILNSYEDIVKVHDDYFAAATANGLDRLEMDVKAQSMSESETCTVWAEFIFRQANGDETAKSLTRFFCKPDAFGDYKLGMFEVLEHDSNLLPAPEIWAGRSRSETVELPEIAERRVASRGGAEDARSRPEYASFTTISDPRLRETWTKLVSTKLRQGRGTAQSPNDLFADYMRVYIEDESIILRSSIGFFAYLGGFQARLAMAGALESATSFDTISTNHNQDVLLHGKWVWTGEDGNKFHLADVSYIFENQGKSHKMSMIAFTDIDPIMRPSLKGVPALPISREASPRRLAPAADY